jgi:hypothetical protein
MSRELVITLAVNQSNRLPGSADDNTILNKMLDDIKPIMQKYAAQHSIDMHITMTMGQGLVHGNVITGTQKEAQKTLFSVPNVPQPIPLVLPK